MHNDETEARERYTRFAHYVENLLQVSPKPISLVSLSRPERGALNVKEETRSVSQAVPPALRLSSGQAPAGI